MLLYIIRHADPIYDPDSLTPRGLRQAEALGRRLARHGLDRIYSSPMLRARQTAQPAAELMGLPVQIEDWTSEALIWEEMSIPRPGGGRTWAFHAVPNAYFLDEARYGMADNWYEMDCFDQVDAKASYARVVAHSDDFLLRQGYRREGRVYRLARDNAERVAVFCHQGFGTTWLSHLLQVPPHIFWAGFDLTHSGVTILRFGERAGETTAPKCLCLSDMSHIYADNLPMRYNNGLYL